MTLVPYALKFAADPFGTVPLTAMRRGHDPMVDLELDVPAAGARERHTAAGNEITVGSKRNDDKVLVDSHDSTQRHRACRSYGDAAPVPDRLAVTGYGQRDHNAWVLPPCRRTHGTHVRRGTADAPRSVMRFRV